MIYTGHFISVENPFMNKGLPPLSGVGSDQITLLHDLVQQQLWRSSSFRVQPKN